MKLKRKIICMGVVSMFLLMALTSVSTATSKTSTTSVSAVESKTSMLYDDQLDQENAVEDPTGKMYYTVPNYFWLAQSFKPTFNILTRVQVRTDYPNRGVELVIRSELNGNNIVSVSTQTSNYWMEFDFTDVSVIPEKTYYILWRTTEGQSSWTCTPWKFNSNPYERGTPWACYYGNWEAVSGDFFFRTYGRNGNDGQHTPDRPILTGQTNGDINKAYAYTASTNDSDGDQVSYLFYWGDGTNSGWKGPFASGTGTTESHTWTTKGTYEIKVKAKDSNGCESDWGTLTVTMPTSYSYPDGQSSKTQQQSTTTQRNPSAQQSATTSTSTATTTTATSTATTSKSLISRLLTNR